MDMREFRSTLPFLLHKRGLEIIPLTIEVIRLQSIAAAFEHPVWFIFVASFNGQ